MEMPFLSKLSKTAATIGVGASLLCGSATIAMAAPSSPNDLAAQTRANLVALVEAGETNYADDIAKIDSLDAAERAQFNRAAAAGEADEVVFQAGPVNSPALTQRAAGGTLRSSAYCDGEWKLLGISMVKIRLVGFFYSKNFGETMVRTDGAELRTMNIADPTVKSVTPGKEQAWKEGNFARYSSHFTVNRQVAWVNSTKSGEISFKTNGKSGVTGCTMGI